MLHDPRRPWRNGKTKTHKSLLAAFVIGASFFAATALARSLAAADIEAIVASPERSVADRTNDRRRHPREMPAFMDLRTSSWFHVLVQGPAG